MSNNLSKYLARDEIHSISSGLTIVGGGFTGCVAAIAAARYGLKVALVNDRPVLGGNSSSEIRVWICGATGGINNRYARETGIVGELLTENKFRNPEGNPHLWDLVLLDFIKREPNIMLFENTVIYDVETDPNQNEIVAVIGRQLASEKNYRFSSPLFVDSSGDGTVGYLAGADYRMGREASNEFNETLAPEKADFLTLGSTIFFYPKDVGKPVKFIPPSFAHSMEKIEEVFSKRRLSPLKGRAWGCHYWWFEYGGLLDTIKDNQDITDELRGFVYGVWNYIKNSGKFDADNLTLEWVGNIPGKRESRRLLGDYILTQDDIVQQRDFKDAVCYGGWPIDVHPPEGYNSPRANYVAYLNGIYSIPFRSLYSRNINNLMFAGRNISATHVAFSSTRVMATCGLMGQAVGTAAYVCDKYGVKPRDVYRCYIDELRQLLLRDDSYIIGLSNTHENDIARKSQVTASSYRKVRFTESKGTIRLDDSIYLLLPLTSGRLDSLSVLLDSEVQTTLNVEIYERGKNYLPDKLLKTVEVAVTPGLNQWIDLNIHLGPLSGGISTIIKFMKNESISLHLATENAVGIAALRERRNPSSYNVQELFEYSLSPIGNISFIALPDQRTYGPGNVINGHSRPYLLPNLWSSDKISNTHEWLRLDFPERIGIKEIDLYFSADLDSPLNNLMSTESDVFHQTVHDYSIYAIKDGQSEKLFDVKENYQRFRKHVLKVPFEADGLKIVFEATNSSNYVEVFEVRVYS